MKGVIVMSKNENEYREPLQWGELDPYRRGRSHVGMWAWILQRASAIFIIFFLCLHMFFTYKPFLQFMLLLVVVFHAALGVRVMLLDFNLVNIKHQKWLIPWTLGIGLVVLCIVWCFLY